MVIVIVLNHRQVTLEIYIRGGGGGTKCTKKTAIDRKETVPYNNPKKKNLIMPYVQNSLVKSILECNKRWDLPTVSARGINVY